MNTKPTVMTIEQYKEELMNKLVELEKLNENDLVVVRHTHFTLDEAVTEMDNIIQCFSGELDVDKTLELANNNRAFATELMKEYCEYVDKFIFTGLDRVDGEDEEEIVDNTFGKVLNEYNETSYNKEDCDNDDDEVDFDEEE